MIWAWSVFRDVEKKKKHNFSNGVWNMQRQRIQTLNDVLLTKFGRSMFRIKHRWSTFR